MNKTILSVGGTIAVISIVALLLSFFIPRIVTTETIVSTTLIPGQWLSYSPINLNRRDVVIIDVLVNGYTECLLQRIKPDLTTETIFSTSSHTILSYKLIIHETGQYIIKFVNRNETPISLNGKFYVQTIIKPNPPLFWSSLFLVIASSPIIVIGLVLKGEKKSS